MGVTERWGAGGGGGQTDRFKYNLYAYRSSVYILVFVTLKGKGTEEASWT